MRCAQPRTLALLLMLAAAPASAAPPVNGSAIRFDRDIRPILSENCFLCHGPDKNDRKGNLRLDVREDALKDNDGTIAIVPGKPDASALIQRLITKDDDERMPPKKFGKTLKPAQIELLRKWIEQGAEYTEHWSFKTPVKPAPPEVKKKEWVKNPIDAFILARLEKESLSPAPEADKRTLIRRATFDLTGLPPTPEEIDAFLKDNSPEAYEKVIDRLLASSRYGEHMARTWLDAARYADTHGYQTDQVRYMWPWRDWVVKAFNDDMPFDQFTMEQIAGDLMQETQAPPSKTVGRGRRAKTAPIALKPGDEPWALAPDHWIDTTPNERMVATGFNRNHRISEEGGIIDEELRVEYVIDRVATTSTVWLGLTMACSQCHDHKYDPISQKDYYRFFAFFNSVTDRGNAGQAGNAAPTVRVAAADHDPKLAELKKAVAAAESELAAALPSIDAGQAEWEKTAGKGAVNWQVLDPSKFTSAGGATLTKLDDLSVLASGKNPAQETYEFTATTDKTDLITIRLEALADPSFVNKGAGRASNANYVLGEFEAEAVSVTDANQKAAIAFKAALADYSQNGFNIAAAIDKNPGTGWAVDGPTKPESRVAVFVADKPFGFAGGTELRVRLKFSYGGQHSIGRVRLSVSADAGSAASPSVNVAELLLTPAEKRSDAQKNAIRDHYRSTFSPQFKDLSAKVAAAKKALTDAEVALPTTMVMQDLPKPRPTFILKRGQYDQPGDPVTPGVPGALPAMPKDAPANRLGLAQWLVDPANPLTARVAVNRIWQHHFGTGLVKTLVDFGAQGEWPSHPELLDWLAVEFMGEGNRGQETGDRGQETGDKGQGTGNSEAAQSPRTPVRGSHWSIKSLHKLILLSATYRQSANLTPQLIEKDPGNRLLARGPRFRLSAEEIRDTALDVSGLLVEKMGGPPVKPYQPAGLWEELTYPGLSTSAYKQDTGEALYRRSLYTFWKRTIPPPSLLALDAPTREFCVVDRPRTNTPLQALVLMNDPTFVEASRALAQRVMTDAVLKTPAQRITRAFELAVARPPQPRETAILVTGFNRNLVAYKKDKAAAAKLLTVGAFKHDASLDVSELAAYAMTMNVILNLDETMTRE